MPDNRFELYNIETQEVIKNPPNSLITWGNTLIFITIIGTLFLINLIQFPDKLYIPFQVQISGKDLLLVSNTKLLQQIKKENPVALAFESYPRDIYGVIRLKIESILLFEDHVTIRITDLHEKIRTEKNLEIILKNNMLGNAEITIGKRNLFDLVKKNIVKL